MNRVLSMMLLLALVWSLSACSLFFSGDIVREEAAVFGENWDWLGSHLEKSNRVPLTLPLAEQICGSYLREQEEGDDTWAEMEYSCVGGFLFGEANTVIAQGETISFYAEEILLEEPSRLLKPLMENEALPLRVKRFSGFSFAGAYWDETEAYELRLNGPRLDFLPREQVAAASRRQHRFEESKPQHELAAIRPYLGLEPAEESGLPELAGAWDGKDKAGYHYLLFQENGRVIYLNKKDEEPLRVFIGAYRERAAEEGNVLGAQEEGEGAQRILCIFEQLGWGGMPHEAYLSLERSKDGLSLKDESGYRDVFPEELLQLRPAPFILCGRLGLPETQKP